MKILTSKNIIQRLLLDFAQAKAGNTPENVLDEIHWMIYVLYWASKITKKVYNNIVNSLIF